MGLNNDMEVVKKIQILQQLLSLTLLLLRNA
mgnify:CR=1 FL=1